MCPEKGANDQHALRIDANTILLVTIIKYEVPSELIPTDSKPVGTAWLQQKRGDSDKRQQTTGNDEVHDIVERQATKIQSVSDEPSPHFAVDRCSSSSNTA